MIILFIKLSPDEYSTAREPAETLKTFRFANIAVKMSAHDSGISDLVGIFRRKLMAETNPDSVYIQIRVCMCWKSAPTLRVSAIIRANDSGISDLG